MIESFFQVLRANRASWVKSVVVGVSIFTIWQLALAIVASGFPDARAVVSANGKLLPVSQEAMGVAILLIGGYGPPFLALLIWRKFAEGLPLGSLFTGAARFRWALAGLGFSYAFVLVFGWWLFLYTGGKDLIDQRVSQFQLADWMLLSGIYFVTIGVQASFEEAYSRGWILQHLARFLPNATATIIVTAVVFSALHWGGPVWAYPYTFIFGLVFGWSAWRLNGLEAAIGAHAGNNFALTLLAGQMLAKPETTFDIRQLGFLIAYIFGFLLFVEMCGRDGRFTKRS